MGFLAAAAPALGSIGTALGGAKGIASLAGAAGAVGNLFSKPDRDTAATQQTMSAYDSLPGWAKDMYAQQFGPGILEYINSPAARTATPLNPAIENSLGQLGQGIQDINANLGDYLNPYRKFVTDEINREANTQRSNLLGRHVGFGALGMNNSALGVQLGMNEESRQRALARANYEAYQQALGLRRQTLADMMGAGEQRRKLDEEFRDAPFARLQRLGTLLGMIPGGQASISVGGANRSNTPSFAERLMSSASTIGKISEGGGFDAFSKLFEEVKK